MPKSRRERAVDRRPRRLDLGRREHRRGALGPDGRLLLDEAALEEIWTPAHLERLARTYWRFLTRVTLGLIRVHYSERERSVVLLVRPLRLLTFRAPEYEMDRHARARALADRARPAGRPARARRRRLPADRGAPARPARTPASARLHVEVEVANFYPSIASGLGRRALQRDPVAHPRDRHPRLPALARAPGPRRVARGAIRPRAVEPRVVRSPPTARSLARSCVALIRRTVPERVRMTSDSVVAPPALG